MSRSHVGRRPRRLALALCVAAAPPLAAQSLRSTLDVGTANVRYADSVSAGALSVGPAFRLDWTQATLNAAGMYAQLGAGGWTTQGTLGLSLFTPRFRWYSSELFLETGGSAHGDGARTGQTLALGRLRADGSSASFWVGGGLGRTWDGVDWRGMTVWELGLSKSAGQATLSATTAPTIVDDTVKYLDTQLAARWRSERFDAEASAGVRAGSRLPAIGGNTRAWGGVSLLAWIASRVAVMASAGTYAVDLTQGFPGGRYLTLGLRLATDAPGPARTAVSAANNVSLTGWSDALTDFKVEHAAGITRTLRVRPAFAATVVEVTGDFTGWQPLRLSPTPTGWWTVTLPLRPATYQMNVRVNGGSWLVPPNTLSIRDESGGSVGLLIIRD
jgi:hypothetical protein